MSEKKNSKLSGEEYNFLFQLINRRHSLAVISIILIATGVNLLTSLYGIKDNVEWTIMQFIHGLLLVSSGIYLHLLHQKCQWYLEESNYEYDKLNSKVDSKQVSVLKGNLYYSLSLFSAAIVVLVISW